MKRQHRIHALVVWGMAASLAAGPYGACAAVCPGGPDEGAPATAGEGRDRSRTRLVQAGVSPEEADARVTSMSEAELAHLAAAPVEIRSGGDAGAVLVVLAVILFAWVLFDVIGDD